MIRRATLPLVLIALGTVGATAVIGYEVLSGGGLSARLGDAFDETYGFFLVIVLGGGVSLLIQRHIRAGEERGRKKERDLEAAAEEKRLLMRTYDELLAAYNRAKQVRRLLRARVLQGDGEGAAAEEAMMPAAEYDTQMEILIRAQLDFESIQRRVDGNEALFGAYPELKGDLSSIRRYLHETIDEYEEARTRFTGDPPTLAVAQLPALLEFLGPYGQGPEYWSEFKRPFRSALRCLRHAIRARTEFGAEEGAPALGLEAGVVQLVPYRAEWEEQFRDERHRLRSVLRGHALAIEHVGSTSIPGLEAQPVMDIVAGIEGLDGCGRLEPRLEEIGYRRWERADTGERRGYRKGRGALYTHHLYLADPGSSFYRDKLAFRDYLRARESARDEYARIKRSLAESHPKDRERYAAGKDRFVREILERAAAEGAGAP